MVVRKSRSKKRASWSRKRKPTPKFVIGVIGGIICLAAFAFAVFSALTGNRAFTPSDSPDAQTEPAQLAVNDAPDEPATPKEKVIPLSPLEKVVKQHCDATKIDLVTTLKLTAKLHMTSAADGVSLHQETFFFRRPNFARRIMEHDGMRMDMGFNGNEVWAQQVGVNGETRKFDQLSEAHKQQFRDASTIGSYLWRFQAEPERFTLLADTTWHGHRCYVVAYESPSERVLTYIDQDSFYEVGRIETAKTADAKTMTMNMSDHQETSGIVMPHQIITLIDGQPYSVVEIETLDINAGLPSYIFSNPEIRYTAK